MRQVRHCDTGRGGRASIEGCSSSLATVSSSCSLPQPGYLQDLGQQQPHRYAHLRLISDQLRCCLFIRSSIKAQPAMPGDAWCWFLFWLALWIYTFFLFVLPVFDCLRKGNKMVCRNTFSHLCPATHQLAC